MKNNVKLASILGLDNASCHCRAQLHAISLDSSLTSMSLNYRCRSAAVPLSSIRSRTGNGYVSLELRTSISKNARNSLILITSSRNGYIKQQQILVWLYQQHRMLKVMAFTGLLVFSRLQRNTESRFQSCKDYLGIMDGDRVYGPHTVTGASRIVSVFSKKLSLTPQNIYDLIWKKIH